MHRPVVWLVSFNIFRCHMLSQHLHSFSTKVPLVPTSSASASGQDATIFQQCIGFPFRLVSFTSQGIHSEKECQEWQHLWHHLSGTQNFMEHFHGEPNRIIWNRIVIVIKRCALWPNAMRQAGLVTSKLWRAKTINVQIFVQILYHLKS